MSSRLAYDTVQARCDRSGNIPNTNKHFDLAIGDRVKINRNADQDGKYWKVTAIYQNLFMCESRYGEHQTFTKREYLLNEIIKVRDFIEGEVE